MASDSLQTMIQDNEHNTTNSSIIQQSIERDDNSLPANTSEVPLKQGANLDGKPMSPNSEQVSKAKPAPVAEKKPTVIIKKPAVGKPANINEKPASKPKQEENKKPKIVMPKPLDIKKAAKKLVNDF